MCIFVDVDVVVQLCSWLSMQSASAPHPRRQVVVSSLAAEAGGTDHGPGGARGGRARGGGGGTHSAAVSSLARIVSVVGNDAADASLLTGAVALGLVEVDAVLPPLATAAAPVPLARGGSRHDTDGFGPAAASSSWSGRYGAMMKRREELQAFIRDAEMQTSEIPGTSAA